MARCGNCLTPFQEVRVIVEVDASPKRGLLPPLNVFES